MKASASLLWSPLKLVIRVYVAPFAYRLGLLFRESNPPVAVVRNGAVIIPQNIATGVTNKTQQLGQGLQERKPLAVSAGVPGESLGEGLR
jgi:hypothetical protein